MSYGDRKKVFKIDVNSQLTDLEFVAAEFRKEFRFESNVKITFTFQRFDPECDFIDLELGDMLNNKDKLIAVVTPTLVTPAPSAASSQPPVSVVHVSIPIVYVHVHVHS